MVDHPTSANLGSPRRTRGGYLEMAKQQRPARDVQETTHRFRNMKPFTSNNGKRIDIKNGWYEIWFV